MRPTRRRVNAVSSLVPYDVTLRARVPVLPLKHFLRYLKLGLRWIRMNLARKKRIAASTGMRYFEAVIEGNRRYQCCGTQLDHKSALTMGRARAAGRPCRRATAEP